MASVQILAVLFIQIFAGVLSIEWQFPPLDDVKAKSSPEEQAVAVQNLIIRLIGSLKAADFSVSVDPTVGVPNKDTFIITTNQGKVHITGTTGVAAAWGFQHYLKYYCGCHVSWGGDQLAIPSPLPDVPSQKLKMTSNDRFRYYQNVCTVSYSMVWWNWTRWEREIDWMAMNAINLPLAFTGQEAIFQKVYLNLGFTNEDLQSFFTGPAFLAWGRMGNIQGVAGPLPQSWIEGQLALQHKILSRMRSFGMTPALPAFAGHVPAATSKLFPNATVTRLGDWGGFNSTYSETYLLDFNDALFQKIGSAIIQETMKEFNGTDHVYSADTFNEMTPKSSAPSYLAAAGKAIYDAMATVDPKAVWLMQGWLFLEGFWKPPQAEALLTSVAKGKMLLLDLMSETAPQYLRLKSYYGQPFIWCMLHNFGGTLELYGRLDSVNTGPLEGRTFPNSTMVGTGLTPEGILQNDMIYEFMNEHAWRTKPRDIPQWIEAYSYRRYGGVSDRFFVKAWQLLARSVYNCTDSHTDHDHFIVNIRPSLAPLISPDVWYNPDDLDQAWINLISVQAESVNENLFRYDFVDVVRQNLQLISLKYYKEIIAAYDDKNITALRVAGTAFLGVVDDLDLILAADPHFLLGTWLEAAKSWANTSADRILYEYNARNQITLWGPDGEIRDYASKEWAGLIGKFYKKRWSLFIDHLISAVSSGTKFNQPAYNKECFLTIEQPFSIDTSIFPTTPQGDSVQIGIQIYNKYHSRPVHEFIFEELKYHSQKSKKMYEMRKKLSRRNPAVFTFEE